MSWGLHGSLLLNMAMPSAVFGSLLAYLWASLGFLWGAVGPILHPWKHFGRSLGLPLAARSLPEGSRRPKGAEKSSKIDDFVKDVLKKFSVTA